MVTVGLGLLAAAAVVLIYRGSAPRVLQGFGAAALGAQGVVLPLTLPAIGALTAVVGVLAVRVREGEPGLAAIYRGLVVSAVVAGVGAVAAIFLHLSAAWSWPWPSSRWPATTPTPRRSRRSPTQPVAATSRTGAATVVLAGVGLGTESAVGAAIVLALFLVAMAGTGLLTTVGVVVAMDTFGTVSDNAQGIAETSGAVDGAVDGDDDGDADGAVARDLDGGLDAEPAVAGARHADDPVEGVDDPRA